MTTDRFYDPREDEAKRLADELRRRAEDRDGWRRFWAGLSAADRELLREIANSATN